MHLVTAGHISNSKYKLLFIKIQLQAGFEPSTLSVQKKSFFRSTHFTTAALPLSLANSSYYNVNPVMFILKTAKLILDAPYLFQYKQTVYKRAYGTKDRWSTFYSEPDLASNLVSVLMEKVCRCPVSTNICSSDYESGVLTT